MAHRWSWLLTAVRVSGLTLIVAGVVVVWVITLQPPLPEDVFSSWFNFLLPVAYLVPGVVLLLRRDWHQVGWLLCLFGLGAAFTIDWGDNGFEGDWVLLVQGLYQGSWFWFPMLALFVVFPGGLVAQTFRQRRLGRILLFVGALLVSVEVLVDQVGTIDARVPNPLGVGFIPHEVTEWTIAVLFIAMLVALGSLLQRYRTAAPVARHQYRWVLSALVIVVVGLVFGLVGSETSGIEDGPWWFPILFAFLFLPVSFMVAILRYRLYEIDRIVSRTVTYSLVVSLLVGMWAAVVTLISQALPIDNSVGVAAATLAAAAAFSPLRRRLQRWVDRRFNRSRFQSQVELDALSYRLRQVTDMDSIRSDIEAVVGRTLQPASVSIWVRGEVVDR